MHTKLADGVYSVGVRDERLRVFDIVMETKYGTTYNTYLVVGRQKTALVECAKHGFEDILLQNISEVIDPASIDYIVVNHTEPDHSGALKRVLEAAPKAVVVGSRAALTLVGELLNAPFEKLAVRGGDALDLGEKTLSFIDAPFLHWPDSMISYIPQDQIMFTCDIFGCHFSEGGLFDDESGMHLLDAQKYYFDVIMSPFKKHVRAMLENIEGLPRKMIAPSHGPIYRADTDTIVELYRKWSREYGPGDKPTVLIAYVSNYGFTKMLALAVAEGAKRVPEVQTTVLDIMQIGPAEAARTCEQADAFALGSPTFNRDILPPVWALLGELSPLHSNKRPVACFGDFGWSGEAVGVMEARLSQIGYRVVGSMRTKLNPSKEALEEAQALGEKLARALI